MSIKLSIIVPAYNAECYLEDCLNSILASTYRDFEILLIDDGSADGTGEICDRFRREYPGIKVFHTENRGLPSARNLGIDHAEGNYIGFVDADDLVAPDMFEALVHAMKKDIQLGICEFHRCVRDCLPDVHEGAPIRTAEYSQENAADLILRGNAGPYVWNKLYRRDILNSHGIRFRPDGQGAEDQFFNAEYLKYCSRAAFLEKKMYFYITTEGSITSTFRQSRTVSNRYISLPRAWRYKAETMEDISGELMRWSQAKTAMFYQTVLRKLEKPDESYIREAISYVKRYRHLLLRYRWANKYYASAIVLCCSYRLWAMLFRRGIDK